MNNEPTHTAVATLRYNGTDYVVHRPSWQEDGERLYISEYVWREGSYSCDCNRFLFISDEHELLEDDDQDFCPCGDTIDLIDLHFTEGYTNVLR